MTETIDKPFCYWCNPGLILGEGMIVPTCEFHRWMPSQYIGPTLPPGYANMWKRGIWV